MLVHRNRQLFCSASNYCRVTLIGFASKSPSNASTAPASLTQGSSGQSDEEFRVLDIVKSRMGQRGRGRADGRRREKREVLPPRYKKMAFDQDWTSVWPTARTFHPATVPLPLHQGYIKWNQIPVPHKFGNAELMKIANFLHLTPPAIQRHCEAIKRFCTKWPEELKTEQDIDDHFPVGIITTDYCHSSPIINDMRSRIVTLRVKLSYLELDEHATDKFKRLAGDRFDLKTGTLTIITNSCPLRCQNLDHAMYLLTALCHEASKIDSWEADKLEDDMEKYVWEGSLSHKCLTSILGQISSSSSKPEYLNSLEGKTMSEESVIVLEPVKEYRNSTLAVHNEGETKDSIEEYGAAVRNLFNLKASQSDKQV